MLTANQSLCAEQPAGVPMKRAIRRFLQAGTGLGLLVAVTFGAAPVQAAGTAYSVDTAEVGDPGNCKVEGWHSLPGRGSDRSTTVSAGCVVSQWPRAEVGLEVAQGRSDDEKFRTFSPRVKLNLVPTAVGVPGLAIAAGTVHNAGHNANSGDLAAAYAYAPVTLRVSPQLRINANAGWTVDVPNERHFATYGLGFDWLFMPKFSMTLEGFGQLNGDNLGWETRPRFQAGVRYRPADAFSVDVIYGRNIAGTGGDWITLSTAYRFSAW